MRTHHPPHPSDEQIATPTPAMVRADDLLQTVPGVGPTLAANFAAIGVRTLYDLFLYLPFRYDDRSKLKQIADLMPGDEAALRARVVKLRRTTTARRKVAVIEVTFADESGQFNVTFFNPKLDRVLHPNMHVILTGKVDFISGRIALANAQFEIIDKQQVVPNFSPVYRGSEHLPAKKLATIMPILIGRYAHAIDDPVPEEITAARRMPPLASALRTVHQPPENATWADLQAARERLVFTECFLLEAGLHLRRERVAPVDLPPAFAVSDAVHQRILQRLPFVPTRDQEKAFADIRADFNAAGRMLRLIQGDVGSGKTIVATYAMLATVAGGKQAALLAPTEILARQHFARLQRLLDGTRTSVGLLTGGSKTAERREIHWKLDTGELNILVGTHALIEDPVRFRDLGLVVIDEQHKFGVLQRQALVEKGQHPHVLVMTATPIPRTLALTAYGDLDVTNLRDRPPGQAGHTTRYVPPIREASAYEFLRDNLAAGTQSYIVCPLVFDSPDSDTASVLATAERLKQPEFVGPEVPIGVLHGNLSPDEKAAVMNAFAAGETRVLVCSTVVEVGVDVLNANVMFVLDAHNLGLVQLHQLRGRIGRGHVRGVCLLLGHPEAEEARERVRILTTVDDGFEIAELDLKQRGAGELFGTKQSGLPRLRVTDLREHFSLLVAARDDAKMALETGLIDREMIEADLLRHFGPDVPIVPPTSV